MNIFKDEFRELKGEPEVNEWYTVPVEGTMSSDGSGWRGVLKKGSSDNLLIYLIGGGMSVNSFTAARSHFRTDSEGNGFYSPYVSEGTVMEENRMTAEGITATDPCNPFHDWNVISVTYTTGDFDVGRSVRKYTGLDGRPGTIHYHGYDNFRLYMEKAVSILGRSFNDVILGGYSAGGFSAALLYDDAASFLDIHGNTGVLIDSSLFLYDWGKVLSEEWDAPEHIKKISRTRDITYDGMMNIYKKHGERVRIIYGCSVRDYALAQSQVYFDGIEDDMPVDVSPEAADRFQEYLRETVGNIIVNIPSSSVYIWDNVAVEKGHVTRHTGSNNDVFLRTMGNEMSFCDCIIRSMAGERCIAGLDVLNRKY